MIRTFACKETEKIWDGIRSSKLPEGIQKRALAKLRQLDAAVDIDDLKSPPGNKLENLKGRRKGQVSIRINQQWRICFVFLKGGAYEVEIVDYH